MWLGFTLSFWQSIFFWATCIAAIAGGISVTSAFISAVVGYQISDIVQSDANQRIAEAHTEAANAHERAAALEKEAEEARFEQEKLKAQLAWRVLPSDAAENLRQYLASHPSSVMIRYVAGDPEALSLAFQFAKVFGAANWQTKMSGVTYANALLTGLFIPDENDVDTNFVRDAFNISGIPFSAAALPTPGMSLGHLGAANAIVCIGSKPNPNP